MERRILLQNTSDPALQSMRDLFCSREDSDVTLICGDEVTVKAHKFLLGFHSSILKSVLQIVDERHAFISLPETKSEDLNMLLNLIYFRSVPDQEKNNQSLRELMNRFNIEIPETIKEELVENDEEPLENIEDMFFTVQENEYSPKKIETEESPDFSMVIQENEILNSSEKLEIQESPDFSMMIQENDIPNSSEKSETDEPLNSKIKIEENSSNQIDVTGALEHSAEVTNLAELEVKKYIHEKNYFCNKCQMTFSSDSSLKEHNQTKKHKEKKKKCKDCQKVFVNEMMLNIHMEEHQEEPVVDQNGRICCNKCDNTFKDIYKLRIHKVIHVRGMFNCDYCPSKFSNYHALKWHLEHPDDVEECDQCGKKIKGGKFWLNEHKLAFHQGLRIKCNFCDRGFKDSSNLGKHLQADHFGRRFYCEQCNYSAKNRSILRIHTDAEHPSETSQLYRCPDCGYQGYSLDRYKTHHRKCMKGGKSLKLPINN